MDIKGSKINEAFEIIVKEIKKVNTINTNLLDSLEDCAEQLRLFLELHEDDEDAPAILEKAYKIIEKANKS